MNIEATSYVSTTRASSPSAPRLRFSRPLFLPLALALLLPACRPAPSPPPPAPLSAIDADGVRVSLPSPPSSILVAGRAASIPADALFLFPEIRPAIRRLPALNQGLGDFFALFLPPSAPPPLPLPADSVESIAAARPSLVVAKAASPLRQALAPLSIPLFALSLETPGDWLRELPALGQILGCPDRADLLVRAYRSRMDAVASALASVPPERPRVLLLNLSAADGPLAFSVAPDSWIQTRLVELAGGSPVWKGSALSPSAWSRVSFEQIAAWNPDFVFFVSFRSPLPPLLDAIRSDPRWLNLPAMRLNRCIPLPADLVAYAQPVSRWILCLQFLAASLHPDAFPGFSLRDAAASFYAEFYALPPDSPAMALLLSRL